MLCYVMHISSICGGGGDGKQMFKIGCVSIKESVFTIKTEGFEGYPTLKMVNITM